MFLICIGYSNYTSVTFVLFCVCTNYLFAIETLKQYYSSAVMLTYYDTCTDTDIEKKVYFGNNG